MKQIFEATTAGGVPLKNRLLRSATFEGGGGDKEGNITPFLVDLYQNLAKGGVGGIITGMYAVSPQGRPSPASVRLFASEFGKRFSAMAEKVHAEGCKIIVQINHAGVKAFPPEGMPEGPSSMQMSDAVTSSEMTHEDIARTVKDFGTGAKACKDAGADAVQIHGAHGYLLSQFLSPFFNKRQDEYGGSIENRARFLLEAYDEVRRQVGPDYPVWVKLNDVDLSEPGLTSEESQWVAKQLDARGINAIELSSGLGNNRATNPAQAVQSEEDEGYFSKPALADAALLSCDVVSVGGYRTPAVIQRILNEGDIAAVSLCRPFIREPDLAARWQAGNLDKPTCISCNKCFRPKGHLRCQVDFPEA